MIKKNIPLTLLRSYRRFTTCISFPTFDHFTFLGATQSTFLLSLNLFEFDDYVILYIIIGIDCTMKY